VKLTSTLDVAGGKIINLPTPASAGDAATKSYVDTAAKAQVRLKMCSADFTPSATGVDKGGLSVVPQVGGANVSFTVNTIFLRAETQGTTATTVRIQRSTAAGAFVNAGYLDTSGLTLAANTSEASGPALTVTTVNSGDKLMPEYTALGTSAAGFTLYVILTQQ
jgi:hypothetical protein